MRELFIYWRTSVAAAAEAERAVQRWQRQLCAGHPGLRAALYWRGDESGASVTLMEVYCENPGPLGEALEQRIRREGDALLAPWLDGPRKVEVFLRRPPPATESEPSPGA